jgi:hypothetical protein
MDRTEGGQQSCKPSVEQRKGGLLKLSTIIRGENRWAAFIQPIIGMENSGQFSFNHLIVRTSCSNYMMRAENRWTSFMQPTIRLESKWAVII